MFAMNMEYSKGILFVRLRGNLTKSNTHKLNNYLVSVLLKHKIKYLVYNLFELEAIDASGVAAIQNTKKAILKNKGQIYLCEVSKEVDKCLRKLRIRRTDDELSILHLIKI